MIGDLLSGGLKLVGGFMDNAAAEDRNNAVFADKERDRALQREFAQMGLQWKVADAKAAGLHPLAAIGGAGASYTPSAISLEGGSMGKALADMGQDVGRAINATRSADDRNSAAAKSLLLEKGALENELLRTQIAKMRGQLGPPVPMPGAQAREGIPGQPATLDLKSVEPHAAFGTTYGTRGGTSQASHIEDQYGEISDWIGAVNWARDVMVPYMFPGLIGSLDRRKRLRSGDHFISKRYRD